MHVEEATSLFTRARQGSRQAVNAVFERYGNRLHGLIRLRPGPQLRRRLESRDILQATLLKAFQGIDRFQGSGTRSMMAWLGTIAHAEICDQADFFGRQKRDAGRETSLDQKARRPFLRLGYHQNVNGIHCKTPEAIFAGKLLTRMRQAEER